MKNAADLDVLIVGGGVTGLYLLDELRRRKYSALLVEHVALGNGQTMAAQGILHGGLKHFLTGRSKILVDALNEMPNAWRTFLAGERKPNLYEVQQRGSHCYCWRAQSLGGIVGHIGAQVGLHTALSKVTSDERPVPLANCRGDVFRVEEQVIDPGSLMQVLKEQNDSLMIHGKVDFLSPKSGIIGTVNVSSPNEINRASVRPRVVVLAAGEGNEALRKACGLHTPIMQRYPLSILVVKGNLPTLNGFCVDRAHAKVIVTTHRVSDTYAVWQIACEGINTLPPGVFQAAAWYELTEALPGFDWPPVEKSMYHINRAEFHDDGSRGSDVYCEREGDTITAWPHKLVMVPRLTKQILAELDPPSAATDVPLYFRDWPRPAVAAYPWG